MTRFLSAPRPAGSALAREHLEQPVDEARLRGVEPAARLRGTRPRPPGRSRAPGGDGRTAGATRSPRPCSRARPDPCPPRAPRHGRPCPIASGPRRDRSARRAGAPGRSPPRNSRSRRIEQLLAVDRCALGKRPGPGVASRPDRSARVGDEHLEAIAGASVEEETCGQLGHGGSGVRRTRKRPKEPYRTVTPTPLPSKLGLVIAAPCSSHLVGLAAVVAAVRGPGPMITHQPGVGATGPFGQTERYRGGPRAQQPACPRTSIRWPESCPRNAGDRGQLVDEWGRDPPSRARRSAATNAGRDGQPSPDAEAMRSGTSSATTPRAEPAGATSWCRRQRASYVSIAGPSNPPITIEGVVDGRGAAAHEPLGAGRGLAADHADRAEHRDVVGEGEQLRHRAERSTGEVGVEAARDDVAAALAQRLDGLHQARVEELRLLDADEIDVALARERQDLDRLARAARAPTGSAPCSGSPRTRRASGRRRRGGRAGSAGGRSRPGGGGAAARRSCPTTCSRR